MSTDMPQNIPPAPLVVDADSAPTEDRALAIATTFGHEVRVDASMTMSSEIVALPSGALQMEQYAAPVRALRDGRWVPIDTTLQWGTSVVAPKAAAVPVEFSAGGSGPMSRVRGEDGAWVSTWWPYGDLPKPTVSGSTATYASVLPGVDLRLSATREGMTQVLVIGTAAAASDPRLARIRFRTDGAQVVASPDGTTRLDGKGASDLRLLSPTWWDSSAGGSADGPGGPGSLHPVPSTLDSASVSVEVAAATRDAAVQYPIFVDPTWIGGLQQRTFVDSAYPDVSYWNGAGASDPLQHVGFINAANSSDGRAHVTRSFFQMDTSALAGAHVSSAFFESDLVYSSSCQARTVELWSSGSIDPWTTWANQPGMHVWQDSRSAAGGYSSCAPVPLGFNIIEVANWAANTPPPSITLGMKADNEGDWFTWKKFEPASTRIRVTFTRPPGVPIVANVSCRRYSGLIQGDVLRIGDTRWSQNGRFFLSMQSDGNLALHRLGVGAVWVSPNTYGRGQYAVLQSDGNFVVYGSSGALWATFQPGRWLVVQNDGNLVQYDGDGRPTWASGTNVGDPGAAAVCYTNDINPTLRAFADDGNGGQLPVGYQFELYFGITPGQQIPMPVMSAATLVIPHLLPEADYSYRVRACVTDVVDGGLICGGWSQWWAFVIDVTPPAEPIVTSLAGSASTMPSSFAGVVGRSTTLVRLAAGAPATDHLAGFVYQTMPMASDGSMVAVPAGVFPANPMCGQTVTGFAVACVNRSDQTLDAVVAALDERSQISVLAFDMAGNATASSGAHTMQLNARPDDDAIIAGHSWTMDSAGAGACLQNPIADNAPAQAQALTMVGDACRRAAAGAGLPIDPGTSQGALSLDGSGIAQTGGPVLDTSRSFTVGAWLNPSAPTGPGQAAPAIVQDGANTSAFMLQYAEGYWRFCATPVDSPTWSGNCVDSVNRAALNTWTFVVGVWDAINHQLRIYVSSDGATYMPTVLGMDGVTPSSGPFVIGRDKVGVGLRYWSGQVANPFAFQGVISTSTFEYLGQMMMPTNTIPRSAPVASQGTATMQAAGTSPAAAQTVDAAKVRRIEVFASQPDGSVGQLPWANDVLLNGGWLGPIVVPGLRVAAGTSPAAAQTVDALGLRHLDVFTSQPDGSVATAYWSSDVRNGGWGGPVIVPGLRVAAGTSPAAAQTVDAWGVRRIDVFVAAADGSVGTTHWDGDVTANGGWA